jgi:hypothetical protein
VFVRAHARVRAAVFEGPEEVEEIKYITPTAPLNAIQKPEEVEAEAGVEVQGRHGGETLLHHRLELRQIVLSLHILSYIISSFHLHHFFVYIIS